MAAVALCSSASSASAQSTFLPTRPTNNPHNKYGSPLDTLKSSHLWTHVAPARAFVRESRPDPKALDYTPLTGTDPDRPKPRDAANVEALQAELEHDGALNERKARSLQRHASPTLRHHARTPPPG